LAPLLLPYPIVRAGLPPIVSDNAAAALADSACQGGTHHLRIVSFAGASLAAAESDAASIYFRLQIEYCC